MQNISWGITAIDGVKVGHYTDLEAATGCTVILCEGGAVGGVDVRGSSPGTREADLLRPTNLVQEVQAILISGGSAYGLDAACGVMAYLEERELGFKPKHGVVPIVPAAILYDLGIGDPRVRPTYKDGYQACCAATSAGMDEGNFGAGTGATVGKVLGMDSATKGGIGTASKVLADGTVVAAVVAVNAFGEIVDPSTGITLAGPRRDDGKGFHSTLDLLSRGRKVEEATIGNTTIGVVITSATLTKEGANKLAQMAQDGLAMSIRPAHTMGDGDTIFALATGKDDTPYKDITSLGAMAAQVVVESIIRGVMKAEGLAGVPAASELGVTNVGTK
ncbi:MAG: peptidase S58 family protein [Dehalococcoidia bacterium]|nr:peptidase S58 family protein [Dehalococcoidia bacterium]